MEKAAVLGVGLIGGSLALGLKERGNVEVCGYDGSSQTLRLAESSGVIHYGCHKVADAVKDADYIFLALPVGATLPLLEELAAMDLKPGCILSDVGSTKGRVMELAASLPRISRNFIGGHPMAGSHQSGVKAARSLLFENAYYVLTPPQNGSMSQVQRLSRLLSKATRAKLVIMDPDHHDRVVGAISHLPHILAAALVNQVEGYNRSNEWFLRLAAGGFRDLTRIAASDPVMWRDVLMSNREALLELMGDWIREMDLIHQALKAGDSRKIESFFCKAKASREKLPDRKQGVIAPVFECYVDVPDHPGEIGKVASLLGEWNISISNIGVIESREDGAGVLRLVFQGEKDHQKAKRVLRSNGLTVIDLNEQEKGGENTK
ncbi:prephenate dehydrogenase [Kroppenstedtia pulmonis]|uniref:Prephenate dehydrogenase n=1 Tax=Kroppenstedtia pulmonis TaxID=1380685 RepID=A0A7D3Y0E1_9BACL|nr:prephenate dehydrogenase [Kroppenstedtia pulmonis]QKG84340.1 prephenate dehydrogenase [Kroppenstedtia pulmonis]